MNAEDREETELVDELLEDEEDEDTTLILDDDELEEEPINVIRKLPEIPGSTFDEVRSGNPVVTVSVSVTVTVVVAQYGDWMGTGFEERDSNVLEELAMDTGDDVIELRETGLLVRS